MTDGTEPGWSATSVTGSYDGSGTCKANVGMWAKMCIGRNPPGGCCTDGNLKCLDEDNGTCKTFTVCAQYEEEGQTSFCDHGIGKVKLSITLDPESDPQQCAVW